MSYVGLHQHTTFSLLDGYCKIPTLVKRSKELGWNATAITDHNHLAGVPDFQKECEKQKIKPLLGMEGYFTLSTRLMSSSVNVRNKLAERDAILAGAYTEESIGALKPKEKVELHRQWGYDTTDYHILFLAKDQKGWNNLVKLQSESARLCTFNGRYHCDFNLIEKYHEGLVCTTACVGSYPSVMISQGKSHLTNDYLMAMHDIFRDDFYLEIQPLNIKRQQDTNLFYYKWGIEHKVHTIATNDSHWVYEGDAAEQDVLLCISTGQKVKEVARMHYEPVFWVRSDEEMAAAFIEQANTMKEKISGFTDHVYDMYLDFCLEAIETTQEVADKIDPDIRLGSERHLFPAVRTKTTPERELRNKAYKGLQAYLKKNPNLSAIKYGARLNEELDIICSKGFAPYFLTIEEMISWCSDNSIPVGPGRGSAAGSLVLLCLGITKHIDPIKLKLWFSRFITKDRKDLPDVDVDYSWLKRGEIIQHLKDTYGKEQVSHIGTTTVLKVKSAIKDIARVFDIPFQEALSISKAIDSLSDDPELSFDIIDSWELTEPTKFVAFKKIEDEYPDIFELARKFEGIPRQLGVHASGILVTPMPVSDIFPVRYVDGTAVTIFNGTQLDEYKACKLDVLGLKTLDIIDITLKSIDPTFDINYLYDSVNIEEPAVYDMIRNKKTDAIFQLESDTMKNIIGTIKPTCFEDIVVINSVARPGPLSCNMHIDYAKRKAGEEKIEYLIRGCDDILAPTYGVICYQELLMAISKRVAGFDDTQADSITRKIIG